MTPKAETSFCVSNCLVGQALDGLAVGLVLTDLEGLVIWMNRSAKVLLGIHSDKEGVLGALLSDLLLDPELAAFWQRATRSEEGLLADLSVKHPIACELKANATQCFDPDDNTIGQALLFCDVTQEKNIQLELSQAVASRLLEMAGKEEVVEVDDAAKLLTPQEKLLLTFVGEGMSNQGIADKADISTSTVRSHLKSIYRKLGLKSRAEAVSYAIRKHFS